MVLITGGKYQGKRKYAKEELGADESSIICDVNENIRRLCLNGEDTGEYLMRLLKDHPDAFVIADEEGCGIIPLDDFEREYREVLGRFICALSKEADQVYRVCAGLGIRLK